jgi:hypothetical protein
VAEREQKAEAARLRAQLFELAGLRTVTLRSSQVAVLADVCFEVLADLRIRLNNTWALANRLLRSRDSMQASIRELDQRLGALDGLRLEITRENVNDAH